MQAYLGPMSVVHFQLGESHLFHRHYSDDTSEWTCKIAPSLRMHCPVIREQFWRFLPNEHLGPHPAAVNGWFHDAGNVFGMTQLPAHSLGNRNEFQFHLGSTSHRSLSSSICDKCILTLTYRTRIDRWYLSQFRISIAYVRVWCWSGAQIQVQRLLQHSFHSICWELPQILHMTENIECQPNAVSVVSQNPSHKRWYALGNRNEKWINRLYLSDLIYWRTWFDLSFEKDSVKIAKRDMLSNVTSWLCVRCSVNHWTVPKFSEIHVRTAAPHNTMYNSTPVSDDRSCFAQ